MICHHSYHFISGVLFVFAIRKLIKDAASSAVGTVTRTAGSYCCMMGLFCVHRLLVACPQYLYTKKVK